MRAKGLRAALRDIPDRPLRSGIQGAEWSSPEQRAVVAGDQRERVVRTLDQIADVGSDSIVLASSNRCPNQAFRIGLPGYAVPFRAKPNLATIRGMTEIDIAAGQFERALGPRRVTAVLEVAAVQMDAIHDVARYLVAAWLEVCADRADAVRASGERETVTAVASVHTALSQRFIGEDA